MIPIGISIPIAIF